MQVLGVKPSQETACSFEMHTFVGVISARYKASNSHPRVDAKKRNPKITV